MKSLKIMLAGIGFLLFLILLLIGVLIGGGKGAESVVWFGLIPLIIIAFGLFKS